MYSVMSALILSFNFIGSEEKKLKTSNPSDIILHVVLHVRLYVYTSTTCMSILRCSRIACITSGCPQSCDAMTHCTNIRMRDTAGRLAELQCHVAQSQLIMNGNMLSISHDPCIIIIDKPLKYARACSFARQL